MECYLNGPRHKEKELCARLFQEVFMMWAGIKRRVPQRGSNTSRTRVRKKGRVINETVGLTSAVIDLTARAVADQVGATPSIELHSDDDDSEEDGSDDDEQEDAYMGGAVGDDNGTPGEITATLLAAVGPYRVPVGWNVQSTPPTTISKGQFANAKVAHRFTNKWWLGTWKGKVTTGESKGMFNVQFPTEDDPRVSILWACVLNKEHYGPEGTWCIVRRETAAQKKVRLETRDA